MKHITSRDNPHFKALKKLAHSSRERRKQRQILLDGLHLIEAYGTQIGQATEVIVSESGAQREEIAAYLAHLPSLVAPTVLADSLFADLAVVETPSGIMALVAQPQATHAIDHNVDTVLLDGVQDPGNLGSILRSAAAAGVRQVLLSADCAQAWSPKTLRAAMGAHFLLDIHEACDLPAFLKAYRGQCIATALDASTSLYSADLSAPLAWVFGSEGQGIRPAVALATRLHVCIPMPGGTESLNVAAAAAVCLFETARQRSASQAQ